MIEGLACRCSACVLCSRFFSSLHLSSFSLHPFFIGGGLRPFILRSTQPPFLSNQSHSTFPRSTIVFSSPFFSVIFPDWTGWNSVLRILKPDSPFYSNTFFLFSSPSGFTSLNVFPFLRIFTFSVRFFWLDWRVPIPILFISWRCRPHIMIRRSLCYP